MDYHVILESLGIAETLGSPAIIYIILDWLKLKKKVLKYELKEELRKDG